MESWQFSCVTMWLSSSVIAPLLICSPCGKQITKVFMTPQFLLLEYLIEFLILLAGIKFENISSRSCLTKQFIENIPVFWLCSPLFTVPGFWVVLGRQRLRREQIGAQLFPVFECAHSQTRQPENDGLLTHNAQKSFKSFSFLLNFSSPASL